MTDYLANRRAHLTRCRSKLSEVGAGNDPENDRFALVTWGAWTPGKRPSTKLVRLEAPRRRNDKDRRAWGRIQKGNYWGCNIRTFEQETVLATFWACPSGPTLKALRRSLPRIPMEA